MSIWFWESRGHQHWRLTCQSWARRFTLCGCRSGSLRGRTTSSCTMTGMPRKVSDSSNMPLQVSTPGFPPSQATELHCPVANLQAPSLMEYHLGASNMHRSMRATAAGFHVIRGWGKHAFGHLQHSKTLCATVFSSCKQSCKILKNKTPGLMRASRKNCIELGCSQDSIS